MTRILAIWTVSAVAALAAVDGVVTNQTTGKPQGGAAVTLVELGSGMKTVGSVTSGADGSFTFPADLQPGVPYLLQAQHQGVNYNRMLPPGSPGSGLTVEVFDASARVSGAQVSQHMYLLEPTGTEMAVSERIVFTNSSRVTYQDPSGTVRFTVPENVTAPVQVRIQAPGGLPITRPAEKGPQPNTYVIRYPMKPGETNIDVSYSTPMSGDQVTFAGRILHPGATVRFVAPTGVKIEGPFEDSGPIPGTGATAYTLKGTEYALTITGVGSLRRPSQGGPETGGESDEGTSIAARKPLIYERLPQVLVFSFAMLALGFVLLFRRNTVTVSAGGKQ